MKLGISCQEIVAKMGYEEALELCKESGFDAVDFGLEIYGDRENPNDIYNAPEEEFVAFFTAVKAKADSLGLKISQTHGRCGSYTTDEQVCEYVKWVSEKDLKATGLLGAPACVIHHCTGGRWPDHYRDSEMLNKMSKKLFDDLTPVAEESNVCFGLETFGRARIYGESTYDFYSDVRELNGLFDSLETKNKMVCMDTGHINETVPFGMQTPAEAIRILGSRVKLLHLHDNNGAYDQHLPPLAPGRGTIDWKDVFAALDEIGYDGVYNFELNLRQFGDMLPEAIRFLGKYLRYFVEKKGVV